MFQKTNSTNANLLSDQLETNKNENSLLSINSNENEESSRIIFVNRENTQPNKWFIKGLVCCKK